MTLSEPELLLYDKQIMGKLYDYQQTNRYCAPQNRQRDIDILLYYHYFGFTLDEIADHYGLTKVTIQNIYRTVSARFARDVISKEDLTYGEDITENGFDYEEDSMEILTEEELNFE